jgi:hypothetical protein
MAIASYSLFSKYKESIQSLPYVKEDTILTDRFLLERDEKKQLDIYYAPFEFINNEEESSLLELRLVSIK